MPDVMKVLGVTGWMDIAGHAAAPTAPRLEYADRWNPVLAQPLEVTDGMAMPADRPGSGIEWK